MERNKKIKIAVIVLAVVLALSLMALGGTLIYSKLANSTPTTVTVPNNLITPDESTSNPVNSEAQKPDKTGSITKSNAAAAKPVQGSVIESKTAAAIELYNKQPEENTSFKVDNMFPGDVTAKYFRVQVSYHDRITVHYKAAVRPGYEKLAEVMKVRVKLLTTGETLYEGPMKDMPQSVTYELASKESTTDELYYEITAYLDTSVGNEYQNKSLIADFKWWVEETGNLDDSPQTGDTSSIMLWAVLALCSAGAMIFLLVTRRRKEDEKNG